MERYNNAVQDRSGNIVTTATITILDAGTAIISTLFEADEITPMNNPFTVADANYNDDGTFWFIANDGNYDISITNGTDTGIIYDETLRDLVDENGVLRASVTHRLDTISNLMLVTDAGDGEIGIASDKDTFVIYRGLPSLPLAFERSVAVGFFQYKIWLLPLLAGTDNHLLIDTLTHETGDFVDVAASTFSAALLGHDTEPNRSAHLTLFVTVALFTVTDGTYAEIEVQVEESGAWVTLSVQAKQVVPLINVDGTVTAQFSLIAEPNIAEALRQLRIKLIHDNSVDLMGIGYVRCKYENYLPEGYSLIVQ